MCEYGINFTNYLELCRVNMALNFNLYLLALSLGLSLVQYLGVKYLVLMVRYIISLE